MSRYAVNRVLWEVAASAELAARLRDAPAAALTGRDLSAHEQTSIAVADYRALFLLGAHPFLLWNFALRLGGGFSPAVMQHYLAQLDGLTVTDLET